MQNKLFTEYQSFFIPGDLCVFQLLSITHEIYKSSHCNPPVDTRRTLLDTSEAFGKVWHEGLIFKLQSYGIEGQLLVLLKNYLENGKQRVVLNEQTSSWNNISPGVPQGSFWDPYCFINDLPKGITSICQIFADNPSLSSKIENKDLSAFQMNEDLKAISNWVCQ